MIKVNLVRSFREENLTQKRVEPEFRVTPRASLQAVLWGLTLDSTALIIFGSIYLFVSVFPQED